jgi:NTE family protein
MLRPFSASPLMRLLPIAILLTGLSMTAGRATAEESPSAGAPAVAAAADPAAGAKTRPRIGLVLSGGGARGAAHIGVLKALEAMHVPVDAIAGTSMGAVVGGLYASGMSAQEVERALGTVDWQDAFRDRPPRTELAYRRKEEDRNFLVDFPLGLQGRHLVIPKGIVQGQKLTEMLRRLTLSVARISDFDQLPTPFRAVATDLESGEGVVLSHGDLTTAMRASMSVPGLFAPVEYEHELLVDGGLAENVPVEVARAMHADILIVVDTGYVLRPRQNLGTLPAITNQMLTILLRRDASRQIRTLGSNDVLLEPDLGDYSSYDFADAVKIAGAGEQAVGAMRAKLSALAVDDAQYQRYLAARAAARAPPPVIQFARAAPDSGNYTRPIEDLFQPYVGRPADPVALNRTVGQLYGRGYLEALDYRLVPAGPSDQYGLEVTARRNSWGPNYLRFGLSLEDDFSGHSSFNAAGRISFTELNSLGAESVWDLQVGTAPRIATELYLPLSNVTRYFIDPHVEFEAHNVPQVENGLQIGQYRVRTFDYGVDAGRELGSWGEVRIGALDSRGSSQVSLGDFSVPKSDFDVRGYFARFGYDKLDSANFPHSGQALTLELRTEDGGGGEQGSDLFSFDWRAAHSWARNTAVLWLSGGSTIGGSENNVRSFYPLGGFLNLSGLGTDTLAGPHYAMARLIYLRKVGNGGEGLFEVPAYAGMSFEAGNVWLRRSDLSYASAHHDVALFFGADTYLGPAYLAAGYDDAGTTAFYLFLGRSF